MDWVESMLVSEADIWAVAGFLEAVDCDFASLD